MTLTDLLAAIVRGDPIPAAAWAAVDVEAFCAAAGHHGVAPLLADRMRAMTDGPSGQLTARVQDIARAEAAGDLVREQALRMALEALDRAGVRPIVFKGAHLAYSDYARPDLRPRLDTDLLIEADAGARNAAHTTLLGLGYDSAPHAGGDLVMTQRTYVKRRGTLVVHAIDLHWRLANPQPFARVLTYDELAGESVTLPALCAVARAPGAAHALLIACIHRVAHHADADSLIWLYDIDRIARRMSAREWDSFAALAIEREVAQVSGVSLDRACMRFQSPVPAAVRAAFAGKGKGGELSSEYLTPRVGVGAAIRDWRAMGSWRARLRLAGEHLLPPAAYMREVYAPESRAPLAWLYVRRAVTGARNRVTVR